MLSALARLQSPDPAGTEPLGFHPSFVSSDLTSFRQYLARSYCDHSITQRSTGQPVKACHNRVALSEMSLNYLRYGADVEIDIGRFNSFFMLEFPQSGTVNLDLGAHRLETRPGTAALISPTMPVCSSWSNDCAQLMVKIARTSLEQHLATLLGRSLTHELIFDPLIDFSTPEAESLLRFCWFLFDQFGDGSPVLSSNGMTRDLEHAFMSALLMGQPSNYSDLLRARSNIVAPRHVKRAMTYIESNLQNEITFEALVEVSGVSARALYAGFNKFIGMPPQMLVRNLRLDRAREELLEASIGSTVAEIAMRWQFTHLGRFSSEYRKRFGESPRDTLRR